MVGKLGSEQSLEESGVRRPGVAIWPLLSSSLCTEPVTHPLICPEVASKSLPYAGVYAGVTGAEVAGVPAGLSFCPGAQMCIAGDSECCDCRKG